MNNNAQIICFGVGMLCLSLFLGMVPTNVVNARCGYRPRIKQVVHQRTFRFRQHVNYRQMKQHQINLHQYRRMREYHLANLRKIRHYQRVHQHHHIQIEKRKIQQIKHRKARELHHYRPIVKNHNYHFNDNYHKDVSTGRPYGHYHEIRGNDKVQFSRFMYLHYLKYVRRKNNKGHRHGDPQSMVVLPNGYLYVLFNVSHGNGPINRIFEYNIKDRRIIKLGRQFHGGHGQGLSYNYKTHQLWLCMNMYRYKGQPRGIITKDLLLSRINQWTLKPYGHWIHIRLHRRLGDNFAYDKSGNYWNVVFSYRHHDKSAPYGSLQIYQGHNRRVKMVNDILHSPGALIQNLTYNPQTNRLYVIGNGIIMSFPANRIHHLTNQDIKVSIMNHNSEFEDLAFWNNRAYLLVHPDWILKSNKSL